MDDTADRDGRDRVLLFGRTVGVGTGTTDIAVYVSLNDAGDLVVAGQDTGAAPRAWFGDTDYEYWLVVPKSEVDRLLLELLVDRFGGRNTVLSDMQTWLKERDIACEFSSY